MFQFNAGGIGSNALAALTNSFTSSTFDQSTSGAAFTSSGSSGFSGSGSSGFTSSGSSGFSSSGSSRGGSSSSGTSARQTAAGGRTGGSSSSGGGRAAAAQGAQSIPGGIDFTKAVRTDDGRLCVIKQESVETVAKVIKLLTLNYKILTVPVQYRVRPPLSSPPPPPSPALPLPTPLPPTGT
jgi:hypothetical protein